MDFADGIAVLYALGSVCGLAGLLMRRKTAHQIDDKPAEGGFVKTRPLRRFTAAMNAACASRRAAAKADFVNSLMRRKTAHRLSAGFITAGFVLHSLLTARFFLLRNVEDLSMGALLQILAWSLVFVYCVTWWRLRFALLGLAAGPLALALFFLAASAGDVAGGLPESMAGVFFLFHLAALFLNIALVTLGFGSALFFLDLHRRLKAKTIPRDAQATAPALATLERINRFVVLAGFPLFTIGLFTGFAWAHLLRGTPVTSDPKEIISILLWLLYAFLFLQRSVLNWRGRKAALMLLVLFLAMLCSFIGVNFFTDSHHNLFFQTRRY